MPYRIIQVKEYYRSRPEKRPKTQGMKPRRRKRRGKMDTFGSQ